MITLQCLDSGVWELFIDEHGVYETKKIHTNGGLYAAIDIASGYLGLKYGIHVQWTTNSRCYFAHKPA